MGYAAIPALSKGSLARASPAFIHLYLSHGARPDRVCFRRTLLMVSLEVNSSVASAQRL